MTTLRMKIYSITIENKWSEEVFKYFNAKEYKQALSEYILKYFSTSIPKLNNQTPDEIINYFMRNGINDTRTDVTIYTDEDVAVSMTSLEALCDPIKAKRTFLDVCTGHITEQDNNLLSRPDNLEALAREQVIDFTSISDTPNGYFIYVPPKEEGNIFKDWTKLGLSKAFINVMVLAQSQAVAYILLDGDAPQIKGLPIFEW